MGRHRMLVVFVDAFGPDQLARLREGLPSLTHHRALDGVFGFSSGALASVLTGAHPVDHGRMCLFSARQPDQSGILEPLRWLGLLPRIVHERGRVRDVVGRVFARAAGLSGYVALHRVPPEAFRWLDIPEREDLFSAEGIGDASTFLADARRAGKSVYAAPWQLPEERRWAHAHEALRRQPPDLAFLYSAELDATLHFHGTGASAVDDTLHRIATNIEQARNEMAEGADGLTTLVIGDHGMADVEECVDPRPVLRRIDARAFVDSTMLRLWGDSAALDHARRVIEQAELPGRWLSRNELHARKIPVERAPYGEAIFLLREGAIFVPSYVGGKVAGMHGYDLGTHSASAALASDAPIPNDCTSIASVAGVVRRTLELD